MNDNSEIQFKDALQTCENEPIHQLGLIQSHGALIVVAKDPECSVLQISQNLSDFIDIPTADLQGSSLLTLVGDAQAEVLNNALMSAEKHSAASFSLTLHYQGLPVTYDVRASFSEVMFVLEFTAPDNSPPVQRLAFLEKTHRALLAAQSEPELMAYLRRVVTLVKELTAFDRVMIYQFDATNWDGEVIVEDSNHGQCDYLGHRFPASDIPAQARRLYIKNPIRYIQDINAKPVTLEPIQNPLTGGILDMSHCWLRSLSPVHIEYLRNMGVASSLSISLILDNQLWGLMVCHHSTPKVLSNSLTNTLEFIGQLISDKLKVTAYDRSQALSSELAEMFFGVFRCPSQQDWPKKLLQLHAFIEWRQRHLLTT